MEYVWYACYGSNLCAERFRCYIEGGICADNGKRYRGCIKNKSLWIGSKIRRFPGKMFFAQESGSWGGKGVAFFDPDGDGEVIMRLYKITTEQLDEVQDQECNKPYWYGRKVELGFDEDGCRIITITNGVDIPSNLPADNYLSLIKRALVNECGIPELEATNYLSLCLGE